MAQIQHHNQQQSLFVISKDWEINLPIFDIVKISDDSAVISPCSISAYVQRDKFFIECDCSTGKSGKLCDHVLRAIGGDTRLLYRPNDKSLNDLIDLWRYASTTEIYENVCALLTAKDIHRLNTHELNDLRELAKNEETPIDDLPALKARIQELRRKGIKLKAEEMKQEVALHHFLSFSGYQLNKRTRRENALHIIDFFSKVDNRTIYLPLFLPEDVDNCGWYMYPFPAYSESCGLVTSERHKYKRVYSARTQTEKFSFEVGDIFYDTPIARKVSWGEALPHIHNIVQIIDVREAFFENGLSTIIKFTTDNPHDSQEKEMHELTSVNFLRYLISGEMKNVR